MPKFCSSCGAALADQVAFCSACGTRVTSGPTVPPLKPSSEPRYSTVGAPLNPTQDESAVMKTDRRDTLFSQIGGALGVRGVMVVALVIAGILFAIWMGSDDPGIRQGELPATESPAPPLQRSFTDMIQSFIPIYKSADTEVRKTNVRFERKDAIVRYFSGPAGLRFQGWVGKVQDLKTERDGEASFSIKLQDSKTVIGTWNNSVSDSFSHTMISRNDVLYPSLMDIKNGDEVTVSGTFLVEGAGEDYVREESFTEEGSMTSPEFLVRFSKISTGTARTSVPVLNNPAPNSRGSELIEVPAVTISKPNRVLQLSASDGVCSVDYLNTSVSDGYTTVLLRAGNYERPKNLEGESSVTVKLLSCLDRGVAEHALLATNWLNCGASCNSQEIVQVFELRDGNPVLVQQISFDSDAAGTGAIFDDNSLTLTVKGRSNEESPHCCPKSLDVVTYRWAGQQFVQSSYTRVPVPPA
jgi:hypothetical protein